ALIDLTDPGAAASHLFTFINVVKSFSPTTAVNNGMDTIELANHGLKDGDQVVYNVDTTKNNSKSRVFDLDAIDATNDTIHIASHGFENGDTIYYDPGTGNTAITGLATNTPYTVIKLTDDTFQLKDANGILVQIAQGSALGTHTFFNPTTQ